MKTRKWTLILGGFVMLAGTGFAQVKDDEKRVAPPLFIQETCPLSLATARVELKDTVNGIAVTFTADQAEVAELRRRVERLARNRRAPSDEPVDVERMAAGEVKYEALTNGARLILVPMDGARLALFRSRVHSLVEKMREGDCGIMPDIPGSPG